MYPGIVRGRASGTHHIGDSPPPPDALSEAMKEAIRMGKRRRQWPTTHYYRLACGRDIGVGGNVHMDEARCPTCRRVLPIVEEPESWLNRKCGSLRMEGESA